MTDMHQIYVSFPFPVELSKDDERDLHSLIERVCKRYEAEHPGRVMWPAGYGGLCTSMAITAEDEANGVPLDFDMSVLHIDVAARVETAEARIKALEEALSRIAKSTPALWSKKYNLK